MRSGIAPDSLACLVPQTEIQTATMLLASENYAFNLVPRQKENEPGLRVKGKGSQRTVWIEDVRDRRLFSRDEISAQWSQLSRTNSARTQIKEEPCAQPQIEPEPIFSTRPELVASKHVARRASFRGVFESSSVSAWLENGRGTKGPPHDRAANFV